MKTDTIAPPSKGFSVLKPSPRCPRNLDDNVMVMETLPLTPESPYSYVNKADLKNIAGQGLETALYAMSQKNEGSVFSRIAERNLNSSSSTSKFRPSRKVTAVLKRKDASLFCFHCGDPTHLAASSAWPSPSFLTKRGRWSVKLITGHLLKPI